MPGRRETRRAAERCLYATWTSFPSRSARDCSRDVGANAESDGIRLKQKKKPPSAFRSCAGKIFEFRRFVSRLLGARNHSAQWSARNDVRPRCARNKTFSRSKPSRGIFARRISSRPLQRAPTTIGSTPRARRKTVQHCSGRRLNSQQGLMDVVQCMFYIYIYIPKYHSSLPRRTRNKPFPTLFDKTRVLNQNLLCTSWRGLWALAVNKRQNLGNSYGRRCRRRPGYIL